jgi:Transcriptional regulator
MTKSHSSTDAEMSHKERTRTRIIDEAAKALRTEGLTGIGVADLMKRAGLTHGGFYAHFESRDDLVAHAIDRMYADSAFRRSRPLEAADPAEGLARLIDGYLSEKACKNRDQACPIPSLVSEAPHMAEVARNRFVQGIAHLQNEIATVLKKLGHKHPAAEAASVLSEMVGAMALARALLDESEAAAFLAKSRENLKARLLAH